jgi:hypothetical protein
MYSAHRLFVMIAESVGDEIDRAVDALEIGMALGIPNALIVAFVAELSALGWIEPVPRPPYAYLPVCLTRHGYEP